MLKRWRMTLLVALAFAAMAMMVACDDNGDDDDADAAVAGGDGGSSASAATPSDDDENGSGGGDEADRSDWPETIRLGFFGGDDADEVVANQEPIRAYLEERLGHPVEVFTGTSYGAVIEAMRSGRVEGMQVGPFSYTLAVQEAGAEAVGTGISCPSSDDEVCEYDAERPPHYYSVIMTVKGSGIETIDDLRGRSFAFVDQASTSGHLSPKTFLIQEGLDPDNEMSTTFAGSHPSAVLALANGNVDAAATHENNLFNLIEEGQVDGCFWEDGVPNAPEPRTPEEIQELYDSCEEGQMVIIGQTDAIPNTPMALRGDMPDSLRSELRDALLAVKDNPELVAEYGRWFVDPHEEMGLDSLDQYYNSLRDIARLLDLDLQELE